jgi:hypothetical protein
MYLDCHPVVSWTMKLLSNFFPGILPYSVGILNFAILFSFVLSSVFICLILIEFRINTWLSALSGVCIAILAPQVLRMTGHLALSYSFFIPLSWYLFLKFLHSRNKLQWSIILLFNNLFWYLVHAYLGMIVVSFLFLYFVIDILFFERGKRRDLRHWLYFSLQVLLPLAMFWIFILATDKHTGRTDNPYGFLAYTSRFSSVFLPNHKPLKPLIDLFIATNQPWEGWAYIGAGSLIMILLIGTHTLLKRFNKKPIFNEHRLYGPPHLTLVNLSALVLLFFSMGYPFKAGLQFMLEWFPIIKNFRGIGRFSWVFFYAITLTSTCYLYSLYANAEKYKLSTLILFLLLPLSYLYEGRPYHLETSKAIRQFPNLFDPTQLPASLKEGLPYMNSNLFQAMIPLPFFHIGSENYGKPGTDKIYRLSMALAYHSGIPIMGNYSTRTSIPESKKLVQILTPNFYPKAITKDLQSDLPVLIVYSHEPLSEYESSILSQSQKIYSNHEYSLYSISLQSLFMDASAEAILSFRDSSKDLKFAQDFLIKTPGTPDTFIYNSFEHTPCHNSFRGKGSYTGKMRNYNLLQTIEPNVLQNNKAYLLSLWMYNEAENFGQDALHSTIFIQTEDKAGNIQWIAQTDPAGSVVINGPWSLIELGFVIPRANQKISVYLKGPRNSKMNFYADDLLIRDKNTEVYRIIQADQDKILELFYNNHRILAPNPL